MGIPQRALGSGFRPRTSQAEVDGLKGLAAWGFGNLALALFFTVVPGSSQIVANSFKFFIGSIGLNLFFTLIRVQFPIRIPVPMAMIVMLSAWLVVCTTHGMLLLGRSPDFGILDYYLFLYLLFFLQGSALAYYVPWARSAYCKLVAGIAGVHAIVGILQFLQVGPALKITELYTSYDITNWDGVEGAIRVVGLTGWPDQMSHWMVLGAMYFAAKLLREKPTPIETLATFGFIGVAFMAQVRGLYPILLILMIWCFVMTARRYQEKAFGFIFFFMTLFSAVGAVAYQKLQYGLSANGNSFIYRLATGWPQAFRILDKQPIFGIGEESRFISRSNPAIDRYATGDALDNGYLDFGAWGGYPAMILVILGWITALIAVIAMYRRTRNVDRRHIAVMLVGGCVSVLTSMLSTPGFFAVYLIATLFALGGLSMANREETVEEIRDSVKGPLGRLHRRTSP